MLTVRHGTCLVTRGLYLFCETLAVVQVSRHKINTAERDNAALGLVCHLVNTKRGNNVGLMLVLRLRRWTNIKLTLSQRLAPGSRVFCILWSMTRVKSASRPALYSTHHGLNRARPVHTDLPDRP